MPKTTRVKFLTGMFLAGAILGPNLDNFHGQFGVLKYTRYNMDLDFQGTSLLKSAIWVPFLFGLAGIIISQLYVSLDDVIGTTQEKKEPDLDKVLLGIIVFSSQYYLSGWMESVHVFRQYEHLILALSAIVGFILFDGSRAGFVASLATALGGPGIEIGIIALTHAYFYSNADFLGLVSWIPWVYFLGGPAVGNLARLLKLKL